MRPQHVGMTFCSPAHIECEYPRLPYWSHTRIPSASCDVLQTPSTPQRRGAEACGVSLRLLRSICADVATNLGAGCTTKEMVEEYVKPRTKAPDGHGWRFVDILASSCAGAADVGKPMYFVSHAWSRPFAETTNMVFDHLSSAADTTIVW